MSIRQFALVTWLLLPIPAVAFCDALAELSRQQSLDTARSKELVRSLELGQCSELLGMTGSRAVFCANEFDFRAEGAQRLYSEFNSKFSQCLPPGAKVIDDTPVSHPDFYELKQFEWPGASVSVSIKDKGQLQKTYVFVRLKPN